MSQFATVTLRPATAAAVAGCDGRELLGWLAPHLGGLVVERVSRHCHQITGLPASTAHPPGKPMVMRLNCASHPGLCQADPRQAPGLNTFREAQSQSPRTPTRRSVRPSRVTSWPSVAQPNEQSVAPDTLPLLRDQQAPGITSTRLGDDHLLRRVGREIIARRRACTAPPT